MLRNGLLAPMKARSLFTCALVMLFSLALVRTTSAEVIVNERVTEAFATINSCNGETINVLLNVHVLGRQQRNGTVIYHLNVNGTGTGSLGNRYVLNGQQVETIKATTHTITVREVLVSKGAAPNQALRLTFNLISGEVTTQAICRG